MQVEDEFWVNFTVVDYSFSFFLALTKKGGTKKLQGTGQLGYLNFNSSIIIVERMYMWGFFSEND